MTGKFHLHPQGRVITLTRTSIASHTTERPRQKSCPTSDNTHKFTSHHIHIFHRSSPSHLPLVILFTVERKLPPLRSVTALTIRNLQLSTPGETSPNPHTPHLNSSLRSPPPPSHRCTPVHRASPPRTPPRTPASARHTAARWPAGCVGARRPAPPPPPARQRPSDCRGGSPGRD